MPLVDDGDGHVGALRLPDPGRVAGDADDRARAVERDDRDVAALVDLGEEGEVAAAELGLRAEEAPAARLLAEAGEEVADAGLVVRLDRADHEALAARECEEMGGHVWEDVVARARIPGNGRVRRTVLGCMERSPRLLIVAALAVTVGLWASAFVAIRVLLPALGAGGVASARLALAAVAFGLIAMAAGVRRPTRTELPGLAVLGATGYAGYQLLLNAGERTVPAGTAALLLSITPVVAAVLAGPLLGERLGRRGWAGLAVALTGAAIVALSRRQGGGVDGALLVAAAAVSYALWIVLQKRALRTMSPLQVTAWGTWFGALIALPFGHGLPHALGDLSSA